MIVYWVYTTETTSACQLDMPIYSALRWQVLQKITRLRGGHAGLNLLWSDMQTLVRRYFCNRRTVLRSR